jgi:hypothetical protein
MHDRFERPTRRELAVAVLAGIAWALLGVGISLVLGATAHATSCRVHNYLPGGSANVGSGTLIDVTTSRERGLVLTCGHLFTEGTGRVVVQFPDGRTHGGLVVAVDSAADLAALEIANPQATPASVDDQLQPRGSLRACGFGSNGQYRCATGTVLGFSEGPGQESVRMAGAVRSGDSGGGVFDGQGRLVAVVWGESGGVTYATTGGPLRRFLQRVLQRRTEARTATPAASGVACPDGGCPLLGGGAVGRAPAASRPAASGGVGAGGGAARSCACDEQIKAIAARLDGLERTKQDRGDYLARRDLAPYARSDDLSALESRALERHETLLERFEGLPTTLGGAGRAAGMLAATALGISGPAGWGIIAAASVGGWLLGRRLKKRARVTGREAREGDSTQQLAPRASQPAPPTEATAAAETSFPIERDDREARELLRLSQLEGRDPLQDAVAGRLALDRLDALAEGDADPQQATWADRLRRELRERFNDIAPTKFQLSK